VDRNLAGKRVGENNTQLVSWHWPGDEESILSILTSIVNTSTSSIPYATIAGLPDPCQKIRELWGCWEEPNGDDQPHACNFTPIFDNSTAAGYVQ